MPESNKAIEAIWATPYVMPEILNPTLEQTYVGRVTVTLSTPQKEIFYSEEWNDRSLADLWTMQTKPDPWKQVPPSVSFPRQCQARWSQDRLQLLVEMDDHKDGQWVDILQRQPSVPLDIAYRPDDFSFYSCCTGEPLHLGDRDISVDEWSLFAMGRGVGACRPTKGGSTPHLKS